MTDEIYPYDLSEDERMDRFRDDVEQIAGFNPKRHEKEVAVSIITDDQDQWNVDLDELFEVAQQYGMAPFEGDLSSTGSHLIRFKTFSGFMDFIMQ